MLKGPLLVGFVLVASACVPSGTQANPGVTEATARQLATSPTATSPTTLSTTTTTVSPTTTTTVAVFTLRGRVTAIGGGPLGAVSIELNGQKATTSESGEFDLDQQVPGTLTVFKPAWLPQEIDWDGTVPLDVVLEPRRVRGLRVSRYVSMEADSFANLLDLADRTIVNTLVFDTKDESGTVLYETQVQQAIDLGAVDPVYDPVEMIAAAQERGLYTITRIVTFEDRVWVNADPEAKLIGAWADMTNRDNWEYPLALAVEACEIGFDEIQFDYVRFPAGRTGAAFNSRGTLDQEARVETIQAFLAEGRARLSELGCAVSAAVFGIVMSSQTDEGIGQRPEEVSLSVDAISPMIYPSHYSDGWLGFSDPNDFPGPVTADALDQGGARLAENTLMRPWLQAFYYNGSQIQAGILEAEKRGYGWLLWNAPGNYSENAIPTEEDLRDLTEVAEPDEPEDG